MDEVTVGGALLQHELGSDPSMGIWLKRVVDQEYTFVERQRWNHTGSRFPDSTGARIVARTRYPYEDNVVLSVEFEDDVVHESAWVHVCVGGGGTASVAVAADSQVIVDAALDWLRRQMPPTQAAEGKLSISFWSYGAMGPRQNSREISVPTWESVASNYPARVGRVLEPMMREFHPSAGGQLLLWQGKPGTGKTWGLRALMWEWREWAAFHYVVDPENFFGEHPDYMLDVLLQDAFLVDSGVYEESKTEPMWKVLILEDTGELLAADAKERTGQALSRLLNVVDGIIGQGLKVLVLVTTNDELRELHPAVQRPGRCAARVEFPPFDAGEAAEWLREHSRDAGVTGSATLADLYAKVEGTYAESRPVVGFAT